MGTRDQTRRISLLGACYPIRGVAIEKELQPDVSVLGLIRTRVVARRNWFWRHVSAWQ